MKKIIVIIIVLTLTCNREGLYAQPKTQIVDTAAADLFPMCVFESDAFYPQERWISYLKQHLHFDSISIDTIPEGKYEVQVRFIIDKEGVLTNVSVIKDPGFGLGKRVAEVVENFKEKWKPAYRNGRNTRSYHTQSIWFVIGDEECEIDKQKEFML